MSTPHRPAVSAAAPAPAAGDTSALRGQVHAAGRPRSRGRFAAWCRRLALRLRLRGDSGFSVVEPVILAPIFVIILLVVVAAGRTQDAAGQLNGAARDGARAASLSRTADAARTAAEQAVAASLTVQDLRCTGGPSTAIDTSGFAPGGQVGVTVTCEVDLSDLGVPGLPGSQTITRTATSPLEVYRGDS